MQECFRCSRPSKMVGKKTDLCWACSQEDIHIQNQKQNSIGFKVLGWLMLGLLVFYFMI